MFLITAMLDRCRDEHGHTVKSHWLGIRERREELHRIVVLHVATDRDEEGKRERVALREAEGGEALDIVHTVSVTASV